MNIVVTVSLSAGLGRRPESMTFFSLDYSSEMKLKGWFLGLEKQGLQQLEKPKLQTCFEVLGLGIQPLFGIVPFILQ
jgi:hypothetical protein